MPEGKVPANGKPRTTLSDQLDRLDGVIDLLADNLNRAVADAARDGAEAAVRDAVARVLADPAVWTRLGRAVADAAVGRFRAEAGPAAGTPRLDRRRTATAVGIEIATAAAVLAIRTVAGTLVGVLAGATCWDGTEVPDPVCKHSVS